MLSSLALAVLAAVPPLEMEYRTTSHLVESYQRAQLPAPQGDVALSRAAHELATLALKASAGEASDMSTVAEAVSDAEGWDANPRAFVIRGNPPEAALDSLLAGGHFAEEPASHVGVGVALEGDRGAIAVLLARRRAQLEAFPRTLPHAGATVRFCGSLVSPYHDPALYVTQPSGRVEKIEPDVEPGSNFCATLSFAGVGRYAIEVVGRAAAGPEVAAILFTDVGGKPGPHRATLQPEPTTTPEARRALLARINALRAADGVASLTLDDTLDRVAQTYSEEMTDEHFFGHITPKGIGIRQRLHTARYEYDQAGENLGMASGPLAAHFALEQSPGHRMTLLDPAYSRVGIGVAFQKRATGTEAYVTELFVRPSRQPMVTVDPMHQTEWFDLTARVLSAHDDAPTPLDGAYRAFAAQRESKKLAPLSRSEVLEEIAAARAEAIAAGASGALTPSDLAFAQSHGVSQLQLELVRADAPEKLSSARCASAATANALGVGAARVHDAPSDKSYAVVLVTGAAR